jgi:hypothetical protein
VGFPIAHELFGTHLTAQYGHQVLGSYTVSGFIEEDGDELLGLTAEESIEDHDFGDGIVGPASMTAYASSCTSGGEKDDRIPTELDIGLEGGFLFAAQGGNARI